MLFDIQDPNLHVLTHVIPMATMLLPPFTDEDAEA